MEKSSSSSTAMRETDMRLPQEQEEEGPAERKLSREGGPRPPYVVTPWQRAPGRLRAALNTLNTRPQGDTSMCRRQIHQKHKI